MAGAEARNGYRRASSSDGQWNQTVEFINDLLRHYEAGGAEENSAYQDITRSHWKPTVGVKKCASATCPKQFGIFERYHHCRKCGDVFCGDCLAYQKRLSGLAQPDPCGNLYKVCSGCFSEGPQAFGQSRNWSEVLSYFHRVSKSLPLIAASNGGAQTRKVTISNFRDTFDIDAECRRILDGYKASLQNGIVGKVLRDYLAVKEHEWKKSSCAVLGNMAIKCFSCDQAFGLGKKRHSCVLCGSGVCVICSSMDLIVFIPYESTNDQNGESVEASLSIIRIVGCPEAEPANCMYLRICIECYARMKDRQVAEYYKDRKASEVELVDESAERMSQIQAINEKLQSLKAKIEICLPIYRELVNSFDASTNSPVLLKHKSNMQALAKAQGDLSDNFTHFVMTLISVKNIRPHTKSQGSVVRNIITSSSDYYHQGIYAFRVLQRRMDTVTPTEILSIIQKEVDKNAMNSCYLIIKQLVLEVLHFSDRYHVHQQLLGDLVQLEDIALADLQTVIPDDASHEETMREFLEIQLKSHRLICPSRRLTASQGAAHVSAVVAQRAGLVLQQLSLQLQTKCAERRFRPTKDTLRSCLGRGTGAGTEELV